VRSLVDAEFSREGENVSELVSGPPEGITVRRLRDVLETEPGLLEGRLDLAGRPTHFAALNTALFSDGLWIDVPAGLRVDQPVQLSHLIPASSAPNVIYPRVLITVGENAELDLIESYAGGDPKQLTNSVLEVDLSSNAKLSHVRVHKNDGLQVGRVDVRQSADSRYRSTVVTLGGALLRCDVHCLLDGKGAECQLDGVYLLDGQDLVDHHTSVEHRAPNCRSEQTYRGIIDGSATAVFDGIVIVHRDAQKTEAHQENRNLLLSESATVHTKPHLEIDADDVICSHGATVGSLDDEQLFYLRARGVPKELAHAMLTYAFLKSLVDRVTHEPTRASLRESLLARIPHGDAIRGIT
jgi:Fe-S cluster assembly protein SufD